MCVCVCVSLFMVAPSSHTAEAVAKYGKENVKVYLDDGRSTYYAITTRKVYSHIKLITILPDEKVCLWCVCVCGGGWEWGECRQNGVDMIHESLSSGVMLGIRLISRPTFSQKSYCIVGNFRGRKLSQISRFCSYL